MHLPFPRYFIVNYCFLNWILKMEKIIVFPSIIVFILKIFKLQVIGNNILCLQFLIYILTMLNFHQIPMLQLNLYMQKI